MPQVWNAVLFDLDGTLLDTAPDMIGALNALRLEERQAELPFETLRASVSHGAGRLVKLGFPDADDEAQLALQERYLQIYRQMVSVQTRLFAGMDALLAGITARGLTLGIVTNKPSWLTEPLLDALNLRGRFACVVSGDTVSERKPHAMPMLHAARLAGVEPGRCVYLGDAQRDIEAAHAAGMLGLVAAYGYLEPGEDWRAWGADGFVLRPLELLDWLDRQGGL